MKVEYNNDFRVCILDDSSFFDVNEIHYKQGVLIRTYGFCSYWVIVKDKADSSFPYKIVFFKNKEYLDNWLKDNSRYKVIFDVNKLKE